MAINNAAPVNKPVPVIVQVKVPVVKPTSEFVVVPKLMWSQESPVCEQAQSGGNGSLHRGQIYAN